MSTHTDTMEAAAADAVTAPLDLLLTDAALGALRRVNPGGSGLRLAASLAARPWLVARQGWQLLGEMARITVGTSAVRPSQGDRRFKDPGWESNPLLRRVLPFNDGIMRAPRGAGVPGRLRELRFSCHATNAGRRPAA